MQIKEYGIYREDETISLYASVGWTAYTAAPEVLRMGFENSLLTLAAYEDDRLVGLVRAVGDGHTVVFVQDLLVLPQYQRRGIGSALLKAVLDRYSDVRQIQLTTDNTPETKAFYRSIGFQEHSAVGCCGFIKV